MQTGTHRRKVRYLLRTAIDKSGVHLNDMNSNKSIARYILPAPVLDMLGFEGKILL